MASSESASDAAMKLEIARLTGAINQHRSGDPPRPQPPYNSHRQHTTSRFNPYNKPPSKSYVRPGYPTTFPKPAPVSAAPPSSAPRDVTINGVAFETSRRSLVRKDSACPLSFCPDSSDPPPAIKPRPQAEFTRAKAGHLLKNNRTYKAKPSRHGNMTLANNRRPYHPRRASKKSIDKPCPRFTTTGACTRGLTCPYKHDSSKIAICWPFLQGTCPHSADTCALSHDPTPERTPLCVHFANNGRCTRVGCPFPHVHTGARSGVCRDFAVLGFCETGLNCERQHVRECPDFAERGECPNKRCKLPHVIRANRHRVQVSTASTSTSTGTSLDAPASGPAVQTESSQPAASSVSAIDARLGDEYISLTFVESESEEEEEEEGEEEGEEEENEEEGQDPNNDSHDFLDIA
ncbi:hypothetical protein OF83DRAFT_1068297 [Amylostereum chailletii]|nr:hypothetical protein OF83DRAFT_1068297 [Amylostereum chailletii]